MRWEFHGIGICQEEAEALRVKWVGMRFYVCEGRDSFTFHTGACLI